MQFAGFRIDCANLEHLDNVGVLKFCDGLGLDLQPIAIFRVELTNATEHLQCDRSL